jgi:hypothetical protein
MRTTSIPSNHGTLTNQLHIRRQLDRELMNDALSKEIVRTDAHRALSWAAASAGAWRRPARPLLADTSRGRRVIFRAPRLRWSRSHVCAPRRTRGRPPAARKSAPMDPHGLPYCSDGSKFRDSCWFGGESVVPKVVAVRGLPAPGRRSLPTSGAEARVKRPESPCKDAVCRDAWASEAAA